MNKRSLTSVIHRLARRCCEGLELGNSLFVEYVICKGNISFSQLISGSGRCRNGYARINKFSILVPNETELKILTGMPGNSVKEIETAARSLVTGGVNTLIVIMGDKGAMLVTDQQCPVPRQWS